MVANGLKLVMAGAPRPTHLVQTYHRQDGAWAHQYLLRIFDAQSPGGDTARHGEAGRNMSNTAFERPPDLGRWMLPNAAIAASTFRKRTAGARTAGPPSASIVAGSTFACLRAWRMVVTRDSACASFRAGCCRGSGVFRANPLSDVGVVKRACAARARAAGSERGSELLSAEA
jgi:hypothetical protein